MSQPHPTPQKHHPLNANPNVTTQKTADLTKCCACAVKSSFTLQHLITFPHLSLLFQTPRVKREPWATHSGISTPRRRSASLPPMLSQFPATANTTSALRHAPSPARPRTSVGLLVLQRDPIGQGQGRRVEAPTGIRLIRRSAAEATERKLGSRGWMI